MAKKKRSPKYEIYQDKATAWRWRLRASNGQIIADGAEGYTTERSLRRALDVVRAVSCDAPVDVLC